MQDLPVQETHKFVVMVLSLLDSGFIAPIAFS